ncbi:MAG: thiamine phosphate synthase [Selenomonadaceae bacterium]|nr:thiamine phosphate synthase [Selenomonadaceae bacterium]
MHKPLDISAYLVVGPENTLERPIGSIVEAAIIGGFTTIQIRSKVASARELIDLVKQSAAIIERLNPNVTLLVDDRLDVVLAARSMGVKVDGIHVGQSDIPVDVCRKFLGADSIIGLSARTTDLIDYVKTADVSDIDYFGAGPLHETPTKPDCGRAADGSIITHGFDELKTLASISPRPIVVGGGVKVNDLAQLAATGVNGFFVVSAVAGADDPLSAARSLVDTWNAHQPNSTR